MDWNTLLAYITGSVEEHILLRLVEFITFFDLTRKRNALISLEFPRFMHQSRRLPV